MQVNCTFIYNIHFQNGQDGHLCVGHSGLDKLQIKFPFSEGIKTLLKSISTSTKTRTATGKSVIQQSLTETSHEHKKDLWQYGNAGR